MLGISLATIIHLLYTVLAYEERRKTSLTANLGFYKKIMKWENKGSFGKLTIA